MPNVLQPTVVQVEAPQATVVHVGTPGLQGSPGPPGPAGPAGSSVEVLTASMPISAFRCVSVSPDGDASHTDPNSLPSVESIVGISATAAAMAGQSINVTIRGRVVNPAWSFTPYEPVFVAAGGVVTQTPSSSLVSRQIGVALSAHAIFFFPLQPFFF